MVRPVASHTAGSHLTAGLALDLDLLTHQLQLIRKMLKVEPMKKDVIAEIQPGPNFTGDNLSGMAAKSYLFGC